MANRELFKTCCLWPSVEVRYTLAWKLAFYFGDHFVTLSHHMTTLKRVEDEALHWVSLFILDKWMERFLSIKIWLLPNLYANFFSVKTACYNSTAYHVVFVPDPVQVWQQLLCVHQGSCLWLFSLSKKTTNCQLLEQLWWVCSLNAHHCIQCGRQKCLVDIGGIITLHCTIIYLRI